MENYEVLEKYESFFEERGKMELKIIDFLK